MSGGPDLQTLGLLGRLAVQLGMVTQADLSRCLDLQEQEAHTRRLGEVLVAEGLLSPSQLDELTTAQQRSRDALRLQVDEGDHAHRAPLALDVVAGAGPDRRLLQLISAACGAYASDLHLQAGRRPHFRIDGSLRGLDGPPLQDDDVRQMVASIAPANLAAELELKGDVEFAWEITGKVRARASAFMGTDGLGASLRLVRPRVPSLAELGLPSDLARCVAFHQGLVLVAGPSGCGKTTTVAALVRLLTEERRINVITVEDPIEYVHEPALGNVLQRQLGEHVGSFASALRSALRQDPDVIVVGELRDLETISLAITAAETGHLVLGTMHTADAAGTIDRIIGSFPAEQQGQIRAMVSESLRAVVAQRLLPRADGRGRVAATEVLFGVPAVANLVREGRTFQLPNLIKMSRSQGMRTLEDSVRELASQGLIRPEAIHGSY